MPEHTEQDWIDYKEALDQYREAITDYLNRYSENPPVPKPPRPPHFAGWLGEDE